MAKLHMDNMYRFTYVRTNGVELSVNSILLSRSTVLMTELIAGMRRICTGINQVCLVSGALSFFFRMSIIR